MILAMLRQLLKGISADFAERCAIEPLSAAWLKDARRRH